MPEEKSKYFVVKQKAVPEVLLKVVEAKKLLESERVLTVQEATERVGISRSSFYKYKEDIFPFYDNTKGKTVTFVVQMDDEQGLLSDLLHIVAVYKANIHSYHSSEYSGQWCSDINLVGGGKRQYRQCFQDGGRDRGSGRHSLCEDSCERIKAAVCAACEQESQKR